MKKILVAYRIDLSNISDYGIYNKMLDLKDGFIGLNYNVDHLCLKGKQVILNGVKTGERVLTRDGFYKVVSRQAAIGEYFLLYIRFTPFTLTLGKAMIRLKMITEIKIVVEMATFPFIDEYQGLKKWIINKYMSQKWRLNLWADFVLHLGPEKSVLGVKSIPFDNGINVDRVAVKKSYPDSLNNINLISVSKLWKWQGLDVLIDKLAIYYNDSVSKTTKVSLTIIGEGVELSKLKTKVIINKLSTVVRFLPPIYGPDLDVHFDAADVGIGVLRDELRSFNYVSALKHRNYAARGIPFVYGVHDDLFENRNEVFFLKDDFEIKNIVGWYQEKMYPFYENHSSNLRKFAQDKLDWSIKLKKVMDLL